MSFSSIAGLLADILIPQLLRGSSVRKLLVYAIGANLIFAILLSMTTLRPWIVIWLVAMAVWGVYYDLLGFANQQFVAETVDTPRRPGVWAVIRAFAALAYLVGPVVASMLISKGDQVVIGTAAALTLTGAFIFGSLRMQRQAAQIDIEEVSVLRELEHWVELLRHVWPVIMVSLMLGLVDATFWTVGAVWSEVLAKSSWMGSLFLPMYTLPSLFMGLIVSRMGIYRQKKEKSGYFYGAVWSDLSNVGRETECDLAIGRGIDQ
jgi:MFS family permease